MDEKWNEMLTVESALQRYVTSIMGLPGDWAGGQGTSCASALSVNTEKGRMGSTSRD